MTLENLRDVEFGPNVRPLKRDFVGDVGKVLWVLLGTVGLVLLIACANVANLFLVRAAGRQQEIAIRNAMGANKTRLAGEFFLESITLGFLGGIAGSGLAYGGFASSWRWARKDSRLHAITMDVKVLTFTLAISLFAGVLFGLIPIFK